MNKQIELIIEQETVEKAERVLEQIGLDFQTAFRMLCKRITKDNGILCLLQNAPDQVIEDFRAIKQTSVANITPAMRDAVWECFKQYRSQGNNFVAKKVNEKTGMNLGSAFIYSVILDNMLNGKENTRTMKFADLVFYIERFKSTTMPPIFTSVLNSLKKSIPYWNEKLTGNYGRKVAELIKKYE